MANLKEIRSRISSVSSTMQITGAMKMVSAAKLKKAQDAILSMKPYAYKLKQLLEHLSSALGSENVYNPRAGEIKNVLIVAITSNRGLCGAFNSILMKPAEEELAAAIEQTHFSKPLCPVYQNVTTTAVTCEADIKKNLINQLTAPVKWTQSVQQMIADGASAFIEVGPGKVLQGLVKKINKEAVVSSAEV